MADDTRQGERAVAEDEAEPTPADTAADPAVRDDSTVEPPDGAADHDAGPDAEDTEGAGPDAEDDGGVPDDVVAADDPTEDDPARVPAGRSRRSGRRGGSAAGRTRVGDAPRRASLPLVPVLAGLLVLLVAGTVYLVLTRPASSSVRTADYVDVLQAARSGIVDVASFDYLTLDDDISQIRSVTTGDLQTESVDQLDSRRQDITDTQAVVNTEVVGAAVGAADDDTATVYMVIQSTQTTTAADQAQVQRYRIEVDLTKDGDRWLLSGITGR